MTRQRSKWWMRDRQERHMSREWSMDGIWLAEFVLDPPPSALRPNRVEWQRWWSESRGAINMGRRLTERGRSTTVTPTFRHNVLIILVTDLVKWVLEIELGYGRRLKNGQCRRWPGRIRRRESRGLKGGIGTGDMNLGSRLNGRHLVVIITDEDRRWRVSGV